MEYSAGLGADWRWVSTGEKIAQTDGSVYSFAYSKGYDSCHWVRRFNGTKSFIYSGIGEPRILWRCWLGTWTNELEARKRGLDWWKELAGHQQMGDACCNFCWKEDMAGGVPVINLLQPCFPTSFLGMQTTVALSPPLPCTRHYLQSWGWPHHSSGTFFVPVTDYHNDNFFAF